MLWKHYKTLIFSRNHISDQVQTFFIVWNNIISRRYRYSCRACAAFLVQMLHPWLSLFPKKYFMLIYFLHRGCLHWLTVFFWWGGHGRGAHPQPPPGQNSVNFIFWHCVVDRPASLWCPSGIRIRIWIRKIYKDPTTSETGSATLQTMFL